MFRKIGLGILALLWVVAPVAAQDWARKMFETTSHDFGTVAAGAKAEHEFVLKNIYLEDIHITNVSASCGCTQPYIKNPTLKTYDKGAIVAVFNTRQFQGARGATLTVTIDKPFYAQVQLQVKGYIRRDVVLNPGSVQFGSVDQGAGAQQTVAVNYAGRSDWQIVDVKSDNPFLSAEVVPGSRSGGYVNYNLVVKLDGKSPAGYVRDQLMLITNDYNMKQVPVTIEGMVQAGVSVNPQLFMGVIKPGDKVTKQLVVTGKKPFKIVSITCDGEGIEFDTSKLDEAKQVHIVPVTFAAGTEPGKISKTIRIVTDSGSDSPLLSTAYAVVATAGAQP